MSSLGQPEFEGSVVGAGGDQFSIWGHVDAHHLPLVSCQRLQRRPARVTPNLCRVVVCSSQEEVSVCGCTHMNTTLESWQNKTFPVYWLWSDGVHKWINEGYLRWKRTADIRFWCEGIVYRHFLFLSSQTLQELSPLPVARWYLRREKPKSHSFHFAYLWLAECHILVCDWLTRWGRSSRCKSPSGVPPGKQHNVLSEGPTPGQRNPALWLDRVDLPSDGEKATKSVSESSQTQTQLADVSVPSGSQRSVRVEVDIMDSFAVAFLMEDLLLNLQVPQTPRVVITADKRVNVWTCCVFVCSVTRKQLDQFTRSFPETSQKDARSLVTLVQCDPQYPPPARHYGNQEGSPH